MPGHDPYKSVLRALDVLELVGSSRNGLQLKYLNGFVKPRTRAMHTLLQTLVERGYLTKLEHPIRYVLGPALEAVDHRRDLDVLARRVGPMMIDICRQSGMRIMYQKRITNYVMVQLLVQPESHLVVEYCDWIGSTYGTAAIFQAYQTPQEQDSFWARYPMDEVAQRRWGTLDNLRNYLKLAATQRLLVIDTKSDEQLRISAPVFDSDGKVTAAIAAIQFSNKITPQQAQMAARLIHHAGYMLSAATRNPTVAMPADQTARY